MTSPCTRRRGSSECTRASEAAAGERGARAAGAAGGGEGGPRAQQRLLRGRPSTCMPRGPSGMAGEHGNIFLLAVSNARDGKNLVCQRHNAVSGRVRAPVIGSV